MISRMKAYKLTHKLYKRFSYRWIIRKIDNFMNLVYGCSISSKCDIGEGTYLGYGGIGIVIHENCVIGKNCVIGQNSTLGGKAVLPGGKPKKDNGNHSGVPILHDGVDVSAGVAIVGG